MLRISTENNNKRELVDLPDLVTKSGDGDILSSFSSLNSKSRATNLMSVVLYDYQAYQTVLALISLAILSYQQLLDEYEAALRVQSDLSSQPSNQQDASITRTTFRTIVLNLNSAYLSFLTPSL